MFDSSSAISSPFAILKHRFVPLKEGDDAWSAVLSLLLAIVWKSLLRAESVHAVLLHLFKNQRGSTVIVERVAAVVVLFHLNQDRGAV